MAQKQNYHNYLNTKTWKAIRQKVLARDFSRCRICNSSKKLHVHHRRYPEIYGKEPMSDLITLCKKCHGIFHDNNCVKSLIKQDKPKKSKIKKPHLVIYEKPYVKELDWI